jgi:hypothetical protein
MSTNWLASSSKEASMTNGYRMRGEYTWSRTTLTVPTPINRDHPIPIQNSLRRAESVTIQMLAWSFAYFRFEILVLQMKYTVGKLII